MSSRHIDFYFILWIITLYYNLFLCSNCLRFGHWVLRLVEKCMMTKYDKKYLHSLKVFPHKVIIHYKEKKIVILYWKNLANITLTKVNITSKGTSNTPPNIMH